MYPRNAAAPPRIAIGAVIQTSDGAVQSAGVTVVVRPEGGAETGSAGVVSYGASSSVVYYAPTQAETNYTAFVVTAYKTGCVPVSVTVVTSANSTSGKSSVGDIATDAITAAALAADAVTEIQSGLATAANLLIVSDGVGFITSVLLGTISDAGTAGETYVVTFGGATYTLDYTGLDSSGNRTGVTRTKV